MKTWLSGDVSKRLTWNAGAETAHELEVEIEQIRARLAANEVERKELEAALRDLVSRRSAAANYSSAAIADAPRVIAASPAAEKIALFRSLFAGRADVFPVRWENRKTAKSGYAPACANEWVKGICGKPRVKCGECPNQAFIPVTDDIIEKHLRGEGARGSGGDFVAGVYPLLPDETCWFLAADFDEESWAADALAVLETCQAKGVPAALERSRSGKGSHVWIFFSEPVSARTARQLGAAMLTETMERRPEIRFDSYDRFFPSQDTMPVGGFGNLIACLCSAGHASSETVSSSTKIFVHTTTNGRFWPRGHGYQPRPPPKSSTRRRRAAVFWASACPSKMRMRQSLGA